MELAKKPAYKIFLYDERPQHRWRLAFPAPELAELFFYVAAAHQVLKRGHGEKKCFCDTARVDAVAPADL